MIKLILKNQLNYELIGRMLKWHTKYYMLGRGTPVSAGVIITEACNSRCIMCNLWKFKKPSIYPRANQERDIDALARIGCYYYSIGGGETTLVKDLPDRLAYAARKIPYVRVITNGLSMTPELARALASSGTKEISISIDGTKEFHNIMRGRDDAFDKTWSALDMLCTHASKLQIVVNSVLTPYNLQSLRDLSKSLDRFPDVYQKFLPISSHDIFHTQDHQATALPGEAVSESEMNRFLDDVISSPKNISSPIFLQKAKRFFKGEKNVMPEQKSCLYPYHSLDFDSKGNAYPCSTGMDFKNGFQAGSDLGKYLKSSNYRNTQKNLNSCTKCQDSMMVCYYEPRLNFPLHNFLYYKFNNR